MSAIQVPSAKVLGKRKQEDEPNGLSNGSDGIIPPHQRVQLVAAFQTIDCHGVADAALALDGQAQTTLRQTLASEQPLTYDELARLVELVYTEASIQRPELPPLPYDPAEPQFKGAVVRTEQEVAALQDVQDARHQLVDADATRREQLDEWRRRARGMAAGSLRGVQGRGSIPPPTSHKAAPVDAPSEHAVATGIMLHRVVGGQHDVFTSLSDGQLSQQELQALRLLKDTDVLTGGTLSAQTSLRIPAAKLSSISTPIYRPAKLSANPKDVPTEPETVDFLSYGANASFAPTYDSSSSSLSYVASVKLQQLRDQTRRKKAKLIELPSDESNIPTELTALPAARLSRTTALLNRVHVAQLNRLRAKPIAFNPSAAELHDAHALREELIELLDENGGTGGGLVPDSFTLRAAHPTAQRPGFYGVLSENNTKAVREGLLTALPPLVTK